MWMLPIFLALTLTVSAHETTPTCAPANTVRYNIVHFQNNPDYVLDVYEGDVKDMIMRVMIAHVGGHPPYTVTSVVVLRKKAGKQAQVIGIASEDCIRGVFRDPSILHAVTTQVLDKL
jgi:hypothetical protein